MRATTAVLVTSALLEDIEEFLRETDMAATAFGNRAMGDLNFVRELRAGRDVLFATEDKARRQMARFRQLGLFEDPKSLPVRRGARQRITART